MKNKSKLYYEDLKNEVNNKLFSVKKIFWKSKQFNYDEISQLEKKLNLNKIYAKLLHSRGVNDQNYYDFINPKLKKLLPEPYLIENMEMATTIIADYIINKKKIGLLGDYDVDGITSTALFVNFLKEIGCEFEFYIPDRIKEGYGPNINALRNLNKSCDLLITLDCGTTANDVIDQFSNEGGKVIIVDHHLQADKLPNALAIINPNTESDNSHLKNLCAVGVVFLLVVSINRELKKKKFYQNQSPNLIKFLDLVALGTICDLVKLDELNRTFVKQGLKVLKNSKNNGLLALINQTNILKDLDEYHLGFVLGPRINAAGRVGSSYLGVKLLVEDDKKSREVMALKLEEFNTLRRKIENNVILDAYQKVDKNDNGVICVSSASWHQGVIGIVASKITEKFLRPSIVISEIDKICKASCRSIGDFNIGELIFDAIEKKILISGGGHKMAAGFSIHQSNIKTFQEFIIDKYDSQKNNIVKSFDCEINFSSISKDLCNFQNKLAPYGQGNTKPRYLIKDCYIKYPKLVGNGHLSCFVEDKFGNKTKAIAFKAYDFNLANQLENSGRDGIDLIISVKLNEWNGNDSVEIQIEDAIEPN